MSASVHRPSQISGVALLLLLVAARALYAQSPSAGSGTSYDVKRVYDRRLIVLPLYVGKYESRIGSMLDGDRLRADIGVSADLFNTFGLVGHFNRGIYSLGADLFTWSRLRDEGGFRLPVDAVDYYVGLNVSASNFRRLGIDARFRVGHVESFVMGRKGGSSVGARSTYSREIIDLMISGSGDSTLSRLTGIPRYRGPIFLRPYFGGLYLIHVLPDTLGRFTPYGGFDLSWQAFPMTSLRAGYELRIDSELDMLMEHSLRIGVKVGDQFGAGLLLEANYHRGRSPFGQYYNEIEETTSLGLAFEF